MYKYSKILSNDWDFSSSPGVKTPPSNAGDKSSIPGQGIKISHAERCSEKKKKPNDSYLHLLFKGKKGDKENKEKQANLLRWMVTNLWWVCV